MKPNETRLIKIHGIPCKFKIFDTYIVAFPGTTSLVKLTEMIRDNEDVEKPLRRLMDTATREWKNIILVRKP